MIKPFRTYTTASKRSEPPPSPPKMASSTSTSEVEQERHYLQQAISKTPRNSQEWSYLHHKLQAADEELQAIQRQQTERQYSGGYSSDDHPANNNPPEPEPYYNDNDNINNIPYVDDIDDHQHRYDNNRYYDEPRSPTLRNDSSDRSTLYPTVDNGNNGNGNNGRGRSTFSYKMNDNNSSRETENEYSKDLFTPLRRIVAVVLLIVLATLIAVLMNKGGDGSNNSLDTSDNMKTATKGEPVVITEPCASFSFHLIPDQFGNETSWMIVRYDGNPSVAASVVAANSNNYTTTTITTNQEVTTEQDEEVVIMKGGPYSYKYLNGGEHYEMVHSTTCLPVGSYGFVLFDSKGDGICCSYGQGKYGINLSHGKTIRPLSVGDFVGTEDITQFHVTDDDIDVYPEVPSSSTTDTNIISDMPPLQEQPDDTLDGVLETNSEDTITEPCASFSMHLIPDQFGNETSFMLMRFNGVGIEELRASYNPELGIVMLEGGPYTYKPQFDHDAIGSNYEMIEATACLPLGTYTFTLFDKGNDGICCNYGRGEYGINLSKGRVIRPLSLGKFASAGQVTPFVVTTDDIDVLPDITPPTGASPSSVATTNSINTLSGTSNDGPCASFSLHLVPDQFGNETSWKLFELKDGDSGSGRKLLGAAVDRLYGWSSNRQKHPQRSLQNTTNSRKTVNNNKYYYTPRSLRNATHTRKVKESLSNGKVVLMGGPYSYTDLSSSQAAGSHYNAIIAETCLPPATYKFILYDAEEDGICCQYGRGEYGINLSKGKIIRPLSPGEFSGASEVTSFKVTVDDIDVGVSLADTSTSTSDLADGPPEKADDTGVTHVSSTLIDAAEPKDEPSSSLVDTAGPTDELAGLVMHHPTTSVNTLQSLATVEGDGMTNSRGKSYGILFDVEVNPSVASVVISSMDLYLDTKAIAHYEIWSKVGSWQDVDDLNPDSTDYFEGFARVSHGSVTGKGPLDFTKIPLSDFHDIEIPGGHRQAFYLTLTDDSLVFSNYDGENVSRHELASGLVQKSTEVINLFYGTAVRAYPLERADPQTDFWYNAGFLGRLWYKENKK